MFLSRLTINLGCLYFFPIIYLKYYRIYLSNYFHPTTLWSYLYSFIWLVLYFEGQFFLNLVNRKKRFLLVPLDYCLMKRVRLSPKYIYVFKYLNFSFGSSLNSYSSMYWLTSLKTICSTHWRQCVRNCQWWLFSTMKLPMKIIQNGHI